MAMKTLVIFLSVAALLVSVYVVQQINGASVAQQLNEAPLAQQLNEAPLDQQLNEAPLDQQLNEAPLAQQLNEAPLVQQNDARLSLADEQYQFERAEPGEIRFNEQEDLLQTRENLEIESVEELRRLGFPTEIPDSSAQKQTENSLGVDGVFNPYLTYRLPLSHDELENCPRTQNYQCRSVYRNMRCFYYTPPFRSREVCCPIGAPTEVGNCNCHKCAVMEPTSISLGKCLRRWRTRQVDSFCYNFNSGSVAIREISRSVPSSCYCSKTSCNTTV